MDHIKKQYIEVLAPMMRNHRRVISIGCNKWEWGLKNVLPLEESAVPQVWCFDVLDHATNQFGVLMNSNFYGGHRIFITHTYRAIQWFWGDEHFHEMHPKRFKRLLDETGFEIVQMKHKIIWREWYKYFRPRTFLRLLFGWQHFYAYEIRLKK